MNKETLLQELSVRVRSGEIKREEVVSCLNSTLVGTSNGGVTTATGMLASFSVNKMLYALGGIIVTIGIIIFVAQVWDDIGSIGRIFVTLGLGLVFAIIGSVLLRQKPKDYIGAVFHLIGGLLVPGGAVVALSEIDSNINSLWPLAIVFGVIFLFYTLLSFAQKHAVLTFFAVANGTAFVYLLIGSMIENSVYNNDTIYVYLTMVLGMSYILLARAFRNGWNAKLVGILYFVGTAGFLGAAFSEVIDSAIWQIVYVPLIIGSVFMSIATKSRGVLVVSTIAIIAYVSYITSEYFADSLGWPISLVFLGLIFIALGYFSIALSKKYIR